MGELKHFPICPKCGSVMLPVKPMRYEKQCINIACGYNNKDAKTKEGRIIDGLLRHAKDLDW